MNEDDPDDRPWRDCRIVDMSATGAGVELLGATEKDSVGSRIVVAVQMAGVIRHSQPMGKGPTKVGMEFVVLTDLGRVRMESVRTLGARW
jgi:hypothetical protein